MADIARIAGVSPSTVSRALSGSAKIPEATRDAIEALAVEHGYVINRSARNLRQNLTRTIGLAVPLGHETEQLVSDPFFLTLFGHIADAITARKHDTLLVREPSPDARWLQRLILSQRADGYIIVGQSDQHEALNVAAKGYLPLVVGGGDVPGQRYCSAGSDNLRGGLLATEHLIRTGRRRIMFLGPADLPQIDRRYEGYMTALGGAGIGCDERLVVPAHFTGSEAIDAVGKALSDGVRFDGLFAASDGLALSAIQALRAAGLDCPGDVAVVGFDDVDAASRSHPALTTIRQDVATLGSMLVDLLFQRMEGIDTPSVVLPVELVVRESAPG
ncbi:LacI family DNA-binding transcriptional regulator [Sphingomonas sp. Ant20]|jgi:DNA-binding LacI/PurR family transcriptional regulator|uniref:LacI family DNA-binding transcriptional regulator n=1 Tax=Sphingomonas sp. Ant20 TaxID=104605 RepID=UPI000538CA84|nr:LacI family DNA-binding transcriptional regulator [Sphingomonas sp. Ant20]KHA65179.1 LacI family transcriptional regulator [Sphingomonas sp. Ant20]